MMITSFFMILLLLEWIMIGIISESRLQIAPKLNEVVRTKKIVINFANILCLLI